MDSPLSFSHEGPPNVSTFASPATGSLQGMRPDPDGLPLFTYAGMVWRRRILVLIVALAMAGPAFTVSALQPPVYQSSAQLLLAHQQLDENFNLTTSELTDLQVNTQIAILASEDVVGRARGRGATSAVRAAGGANSNVITLTASDSDPAQAAATVEAYASAYAEYGTQQERQALEAATVRLDERLGLLQDQINASRRPEERIALEEQRAIVQEQLGRVQIQRGLATSGGMILNHAPVPASPISPKPLRDASLALVIGLALGISLAVLLETVRRRSSSATTAPTTLWASEGSETLARGVTQRVRAARLAVPVRSASKTASRPPPRPDPQPAPPPGPVNGQGTR